MTTTEKKILNAIKYFVKHTNKVGRTKLFKLLFFWDFYHLAKYGKSITGYKYFTYPFGPVPKSLFDIINNNDLPTYLSSHLDISDDNEYDDIDEFKRFKINLKNKEIDLGAFTPYERQVLEKVAEIFKYATAKDMTEATHFHNTPWKITMETKGKFKEIDYLLGRNEETPFDDEEIKERLILQTELSHNGYNR